MISNEDFKKLVAKNLVYYRKLNGLTQLQLAEKTYYSDKAISKWERGESLPETYVLYMLADFYGITINDFFVKDRVLNVSPTRKAKAFVVLIVFFAVWLLFTTFFTFCYLIEPLGAAMLSINSPFWMAFIYAIPVSFIVVYILSTVWFKDTPLPLFAMSVVIWTIGLAVFLVIQNTEVAFKEYAWLIFILLIFVQIIVILCHWLIRVRNQLNISILTWLKKSFTGLGRYIKSKFPSSKNKNDKTRNNG